MVCGQCLEINSVTDLLVELNTHELVLLNNLVLKLRSSLYKKPESTHKILHSSNSKQLEITEKHVSYSIENQLTDSGFESFNYAMRNNRSCTIKSTANRNRPIMQTSKIIGKIVPFDVSFVGGIFSFKLYHIEVS